jgi:hypothetical protein
VSFIVGREPEPLGRTGSGGGTRAGGSFAGADADARAGNGPTVSMPCGSVSRIAGAPTIVAAIVGSEGGREAVPGAASGRTAGMRVESMRTAAISLEPSVESE